MPAAATHSSAGSNIFKCPIAQIAIKRVGAVDGAEINIAPTVAIEVAERHAGALHEIVVLHHQPVVQHVSEVDAHLRSRHQCETGVAGRRHREPGHAPARDGLPFQSGRRAAPARREEKD